MGATMTHISNELLKANWKHEVDLLHEKTFEFPGNVEIQKAWQAELKLFMETYPDNETPDHIIENGEEPQPQVSTYDPESDYEKDLQHLRECRDELGKHL